MSVSKVDIPASDKLIHPTLRVLHRLGGSGTIHEIEDEIASELKLSEELANYPHGKGSQTEIGYRAAWARTALKNAGLIENSDRGVWALTAAGVKAEKVDSRKLVRNVKKLQRLEYKLRRVKRRKADLEEFLEEDKTGVQDDTEEQDWREKLLDVLLAMDPIAFERLCQRLLRESGFIEVEVTKRSGDGGIDGFGTIRIGGLISFNVLFQSKRYKSNIGPDVVRDFRGAMVGRADKGLIITTSGFTREARKEATRDGAPPIDLIDGELLIQRLKEMRLGVTVRMVEEVEVNAEWFKSI